MVVLRNEFADPEGTVFGRWEADPESTTRLQCMIVFVEVESRKLRLDCLAVEPVNAPGLHLDRGTPFTVTADLPVTEWVAYAVSALDRWAAEARLVEVQLVRKSGMARVRATDGQTRMLLDQ